MNNKTAIGLVAAIIILVGAYVVFNKPVQPPAILPPTASSTSTGPSASTTLTLTPLSAIPTTPIAGTHRPSVQVATDPQPKKIPAGQPKPIVTVDTASLTASTARPVITGTANVKVIGYVLDDPAGVGIAGSSDITVENGRWSFVPPQALKTGIYTLHLIGGDTTLNTKLHVTAP
jgi:hypothetical protein